MRHEPAGDVDRLTATGEPMLAAARRSAIHRQVERDGGATIQQLVHAFGVSAGTVRRDIALLDAAGALVRVHGGAVCKESGPRAAAREALAAKASHFAYDGAVVALSAGTISVAVAKRLAELTRLTVVTYALPVALAFQQRQRHDQTLLLTGGVLTSAQGLHGPLAEDNLRSLSIDVGFIQVDGVDPATGLSNLDDRVAELNRAIAGTARQVVHYADHTAWHHGGALVSTVDKGTTLLVDAYLPAVAKAELASTGATVVVAPRLGETDVQKTDA